MAYWWTRRAVSPSPVSSTPPSSSPLLLVVRTPYTLHLTPCTLLRTQRHLQPPYSLLVLRVHIGFIYIYCIYIWFLVLYSTPVVRVHIAI